jgi:ADP-heptose:LPS heptosyltransferase
VTWQADSGAFCALVEASDLYLGYDSAGQHVAAAAGTPAVTLFVTSAGSRHLRRWSPHGRRARVLAVPPGADEHAAAAAVLRMVAS